MKKATLILALFIGFIPLLNAQWTSPGNGTTYSMSELVNLTDGVVTFESNNYYIHADLTISQNDVLKIDNGFTKIFIEDALITIKGSMICENANRVSVMGEPHFSMRFENATGCEVKKMYFSDGNGIKVIESDVSFSDTKFLYFTRDYANAVIDFMNCNPIIENCIFMMNESAAISSPANGQGSPQILNCMFDANADSNGFNSPQINLGPGGEDTIRIVGNNIDDRWASWHIGGISVADLMGTGSTKVLLKDNVISNGRYGYNQQGLTLSSVIERNQFVDNHYEDNPMNGGSGISIYGMNENNKAVIRNNTITGNLWGITVINAADVNLGTDEDFGLNWIHDNGNNGVIYDLYNNSTYDIMACGNDWGSMDPEEVEDHIYHQYDNPSLGLVHYYPLTIIESINESTSLSFEISPNPVSNGVFSLVLDEVQPSKMAIYNLNGQLIKSQQIDNKENTINIESLESGVYFVEVKNAGGKTVKRIVVR